MRLYTFVVKRITTKNIQHGRVEFIEMENEEMLKIRQEIGSRPGKRVQDEREMA